MNWRTLEGVVSAVVTPMHSDGSIDNGALEDLCRWQIGQGVHAMLALGGTGEYTSLAPAERVNVVSSVLNAVDGKVPVMAGMLSVGLEDSVEMGKRYRDAGVEAVMPITPYYYRVTQDGIRRYVNELGRRLKMPLFIFNVPSRTGSNLEATTLAKIVDECEWVVGLKECNTDLVHFAHVLMLVGDKISVLTGEDYWFFAHVALGARGGIIASANTFPKTWVEMYNKLKAGDLAGAKKLHYALLPAFDALFAEPNPGPLKKAMELLGRPVGGVRAPLVDPSPTTVENLKRVLKGMPGLH